MAPIMFTVEARVGNEKRSYQTFDLQKAYDTFAKAILVVGNAGTVKLINGTTYDNTVWDGHKLEGNTITIRTIKHVLEVA